MHCTTISVQLLDLVCVLFVCMYVSVYVCTYVRIYVHACMYVCLSVECAVITVLHSTRFVCMCSTLQVRLGVREVHACVDVDVCQSVAHLKLCSRVAVQVLHTSIATSDQLNRVHYAAVNIHKA